MSNEFYQTLSRYYDALFPVDDKDMQFFVQQTEGREHLLDMGCGTGNKTVHFSRAVTSITAFDNDPGMIARAEIDNPRPNITYMVLNMEDMGKAFPEQSFDAVFCLGNTLVHLDGPEQMESLLRSVYGLLKPDGVFCLQILNYDRVLDKEITSLPPLESPEVLFTRNYAPEGNKLHFLTSITVKETGRKLDNDVPLYPLRRKELQKLFREAGFDGQPTLYGSYSGDPYEADSFVCIALGRRQSE